MMDWTDRHCRCLPSPADAPCAALYRDGDGRGDPPRRPRAAARLRSGANIRWRCSLAARSPPSSRRRRAIAADFGYDEINLNVGCPSDRVQSGAFGACLMREPELVADCVAAMKARCAIPVTVKCRIGVDDQDPETSVRSSPRRVVAAGADALIVHARKAWLKGLSPRRTATFRRSIMLCVYALKREFPDVPIMLNGGLDRHRPQMQRNCAHVDGVMIGRAAYQDPALLLDVDPVFFGDAAPAASRQAARRGLYSLCRGAPGRRRAACRDDAACARPVQRLCRARVPSAAIWRPRR